MGEEFKALVDFKKDDCVREVNPESVDGGEMPDTKIHNTNYNWFEQLQVPTPTQLDFASSGCTISA